MAISMLKKLPGTVLTKINKAVGFRLVTKFGQKGVINLAKGIPVLGGVVGGGIDIAFTKQIANLAKENFVRVNNNNTFSNENNYSFDSYSDNNFDVMEAQISRKSVYDLVNYTDKEIKDFLKDVIINKIEDFDWYELNLVYNKIKYDDNEEDVDSLLDFHEIIDEEECELRNAILNTNVLFENTVEIKNCLNKIFESIKLVTTQINNRNSSYEEWFDE